MESVFADGAFSFAGDIAHVAAREDAPNPCLLIDGIGTVGVPLSNREAGILWTQASPVTSEGVLLKNVWSIKGSKIGLQSKTWVSWLDKLVLQVARDELGIWAPENHKLQCSLTELYLCGMGAKTLPANAVATVSVLLPSLYEGGKLAFCHEDRSKCADLANFSATKTIVLVAHTNVIAHMSEVTNGLRLALSYDLLCTNDGQLVNKSVCPMLPSMISATVALDKVLNQWNRGRYKRESIQDPPLFALALPQELPGDVCSLGTSGLSGGNARAVSYLASSADDLGFVLALATFVACMAGFDALKRMLER
ncbi:hypothetical protein BKA70DRAFT_1103212 [Coprinopsis sp. MPI-PUGE-AT-0042]|nr:hypothetical protein BKA70DRAFT_1103212 [Coprinopsis sp. MPI-PUGE-AT-0042]